MSTPREIRSYDYVNRPYDEVRKALAANPNEVFARATRSATSRAKSVAAGLSINLGGIEVATEIDLTTGQIEEQNRSAGRPQTTRIPIEWQASNRPHLFPFMDAVLSIYPLTATETQLDFVVTYRPPLGALGKLIDNVAGHRLAEAAVHRFVADTADYLRSTVSMAKEA